MDPDVERDRDRDRDREPEPCPEPEPRGARPGPPPTRWGICGAGAISHDFVLALGTLPRSEHTVVAVAARDLGRAQTFARRLGVPRAYGSYEELAQDPDIDVVYVGTVNPTHLPAGLLFLRRGRAVLMEKPMALDAREVAQLVGTARERGVFLMEVPLPSAPSLCSQCCQCPQSPQSLPVPHSQCPQSLPVPPVPHSQCSQCPQYPIPSAPSAPSPPFPVPPVPPVPHSQSSPVSPSAPSLSQSPIPSASSAPSAPFPVLPVSPSPPSTPFPPVSPSPPFPVPPVPPNLSRYPIPSAPSAPSAPFPAPPVPPSPSQSPQSRPVPHSQPPQSPPVLPSPPSLAQSPIPSAPSAAQSLPLIPFPVLPVSPSPPSPVPHSQSPQSPQHHFFPPQGFWTRFFPAWRRLRSLAAGGSLGSPLVLRGSLGFALGGVPRLREPALGGGALLDLGGYGVQAALALLGGGQGPPKLRAHGRLHPTGVDESVSVTLEFPGGGLAALLFSMAAELPGGAALGGPRGWAELPSHMNCPTELFWGGRCERFPLPPLAETPNFPHGAGLRFEAQHVRDCLLRGLTESPEMPLAESEVIARLLDEARAQVGVRLSGVTTDHLERPLTLPSDQRPPGVTTDPPE
uniref:Trans-1,2-dihydrobenzene-1,2-diol dehydrogenase n=1 Tax=Taeniopygia guttata TaxID=59729 RepID=A0A674HPN0_TAEGU